MKQRRLNKKGMEVWVLVMLVLLLIFLVLVLIWFGFLGGELKELLGGLERFF